MTRQIDVSDSNQIWKLSGLCGIPILTVLLIGMLVYSSIKPLEITANESFSSQNFQTASTIAVNLRQVFPKASDDAEKFYIPMDIMVTQDSIRIENSYLSRQMTLLISGMSEKYFDTESMYGNLSGIQAVQVGQREDDLVILISLDSIYEYEMVFENQKLSLLLKKPSEKYDRIVVLDPGLSDSALVSDEDKKVVTTTGDRVSAQIMKLAGYVKENLEQSGVRVYMTRSDNTFLELEERIKLAKCSEADLYIELHMTDSMEYGLSATYDEKYFCNRLDNVTYAELVLQEATKAISNRANTLEGTSEDELLKGLSLPAFRLNVGSFKQADESALLSRDDYLMDMSNGISNGIIQALEQLEER